MPTFFTIALAADLSQEEQDKISAGMTTAMIQLGHTIFAEAEGQVIDREHLEKVENLMADIEAMEAGLTPEPTKKIILQ